MNKRGFTLIEIVITILILGASAAIFTTVLSEGNRAYLFLSRQNQIVQESRVAMNRMIQELTSEVLLGTNNPAMHSFDTVNRPDASYLEFTRNSDSQTVIYSLAAGNLTRNLAGTSRVLAENVTNFTLTYLDAAEVDIVPLPVAADRLDDIASIKIELTIQKGDESITLKSAVSPKNAPL